MERHTRVFAHRVKGILGLLKTYYTFFVMRCKIVIRYSIMT